MQSIGRYLLRKLRKDERPPALPDEAQLKALAKAATSGTATARDELAAAMLAIESSHHDDTRRSAESVLNEMDARAWFALDVASRKSWYVAPSWSQMVRMRLNERKPSPLTLVLASFHPDGRIREAAVARMSEVGDLITTRAVAVRCGDWVEEVRIRARMGVERRLAEDPGSLLAATPLGLAMKERRFGAWLAERIEHELRRADETTLRMAMKAHDWRTRRLAYEVAIDRSLLSLSELLQVALHDADLPTRSRATEAAVVTARRQGDVERLEELLASRTAYVRGEAVSALARAGDFEPAFAALIDRSSVVRWLAQAAVRRAGNDPVERYRTLASAVPPLPAVLLGLGETGASSDIPLVTRWTHHDLARVRAAALHALRRLGGATPQNCADLLQDSSAAVTREAANALAGRAQELDGDFLEGLIDPNRPRHVRVAAFRLLRQRGMWTRLATDLRFVGDSESAVAERARVDLDMWLRREAATAYQRPIGDDADRLGRLLSDAEPLLSAQSAKLLRFHLGLQRSVN